MTERLERAQLLVRLCAAEAAYTTQPGSSQNFRAAKIVSDRGFKSLGSQRSHHAKWKKSVFKVYRVASLPWGVDSRIESRMRSLRDSEYFSAPYDLEAVDMPRPLRGPRSRLARGISHGCKDVAPGCIQAKSRCF